MMIYKGCNCRCIFPFPYPRSEVSTLYVTFQEKGETVVEKELADCDFLEEKIAVKLSQEETLRFGNNVTVKIQIRGKLIDNTAIKSNIMQTYTDKVLKDGVI